MKLRLGIMTLALGLLAMQGCEQAPGDEHQSEQQSSAKSANGSSMDSTHQKHMKDGKHPAEHSKPAQRVEIKVKPTGYEPDMVMARAGQPITLVFTRTSDKGCGDQLLIPTEGIKKDLPLGVPVEVMFTPKESGNIGFSCGMKMLKGTIMVH